MYKFLRKLKKELISAPIISALDWSKPFEIMCDASDFIIGPVLWQRIDNKEHIIYYSSKTQRCSNELHYNREGILGGSVCFGEISSLPTRVQNYNFHRLFCAKTPYDEKGCQGLTHSLDPPYSRIWSQDWDKKGVENIVTDYLSRIPNSQCNELPIIDDFSNEKFLAVFREPWFADIVNYLVTN